MLPPIWDLGPLPALMSLIRPLLRVAEEWANPEWLPALTRAEPFHTVHQKRLAYFSYFDKTRVRNPWERPRPLTGGDGFVPQFLAMSSRRRWIREI